MSETDDEVAAIVRRLEYARLELDPSALLDSFKMMGAMEARHDARLAALEAKIARTKRGLRRLLWVTLALNLLATAYDVWLFCTSLHPANHVNLWISAASFVLCSYAAADITRIMLRERNNSGIRARQERQ